jgi:crotonobetainyl-CoA:carnitine CoA-transferase CaiB-like acyl-CoA transferase
MSSLSGPLSGFRVIESSLLGPGAITTHLADLGAEVIKVESPSGDYIREMTWPIVEGVSLLHLHVHRGKKSITLDLRTEEGVAVYLDLVRDADAVVEAMRPGALAKRGLGYERLREVNPRIVFCNISGYGSTGPYRDLPAHGIAFDTWAGIVNPAYDDEGFCYIPEHASMGMHAGPLFGAFGILAGVLRARATGTGCALEIGQSDAAAYMDWYRSESWKAYERPESEVTGNKSDDYVRRAPGTAGMREGVRYQMYESSDGHVLFMASEQAFWKNFCAEWIRLGGEKNFPIAPVNTPKTIADDPQFRERLPWYPASKHGVDMLPFPVKFEGEELPEPSWAPTVGEHTEAVMREVLGYDADRIEALRKAGAFG